MNTHLNYPAAAAILPLIMAFFIAGYSQTNPAVESEEIVKIETNLVKVSFIEPETKVNSYQVFDGSREVTDFTLISPAEEPNIDWVIYLDGLSADSNGRKAMNSLGGKLRAAANKLSPPLVVIRADDDSSAALLLRSAGLNDDRTVVTALDPSAAFEIINRYFNDPKRRSRKAFLWLTGDSALMSADYDFLAANLLDSSVFSLIGNIDPEKKRPGVQQVISYSNFRLDTRYAAVAGADESRPDVMRGHFNVFFYECARLHTVFFESDNPAGTTSSVNAVDRAGRITPLQSKRFFFGFLKAYDTLFLKANDTTRSRTFRAAEIGGSVK